MTRTSWAAAGAMFRLLTLVYAMEEVMRIRRAIIIPALLTMLGAAGSIMAGSAMPLAAAQAHTAHVVVADSGPDVFFHG